MIISHKYKFIFVKPRKVDASGLELALAEHCGEQDVITRVDRHSNSMNDDQHYYPGNNYGDFHQHMNSVQIKKKVGEDLWKNYYTFTIARNPWDMVVSCYLSMKPGSRKFRERIKLKIMKSLGMDIGVHGMDFPDFLRHFRKEWKNENFYWDESGKPICDFILRYEYLRQDYRKLCEDLGMPYNKSRHLKTEKTDRLHYSGFYNDETKKIVRDMFKKEIDAFGYKFESGRFIDKGDLARELKGRPWLVSHGGVSSQYLTDQLNIDYPQIRIDGRKLDDVVVHFPYPVKSGPSLCIYLYGDIYNSMISQMARHNINPAKLHNRKDYPRFKKLEDVLNYSDKDPYGLDAQIRRYMADKTDYPIVLLKYPLTEHSLKLLEAFMGKKVDYDLSRKRGSSMDTLDKKTKEKLISMYGSTEELVKNSPDFIVKYPNSDYALSQKDVLKYEVTNSEILRNRIKNGLEYPRLITLGNTQYAIANGTEHNGKRRMYLINPKTEKRVKLWINNADTSEIDKQENWTPYVKGHELYFISSFNELCVLKVLDIERGECRVIKGNPLNHINKDVELQYTGGTPLMQWNYPYYVGFATYRTSGGAVPLIYDSEKMEVVKLGSRIQFETPKKPIPSKEKSVQFPYDLQIKDGKIILGMDFVNQSSTLIHLNCLAFCKQFS